MKKTESTVRLETQDGEGIIKLKPGRERYLKGKGIEGLFELIFYRKPSLSNVAKRFVENLVTDQNRKGMSVSDWRSWTHEVGITQRQYYDVVSKLRGVGMVRKERGRYILSRDFSRMLAEMADVWDAWRESIREDQDRGA